MRLSELIEEIEKLGWGKWSRTIIPRKTDVSVIVDDTPLEKATIHPDSDVLLSELCESLKKATILSGCYISVATNNNKHFHVTTMRGQKVVMFQGESHTSWEDIVKKTGSSLESVSVSRIDFCFNMGSFRLIFG